MRSYLTTSWPLLAISFCEVSVLVAVILGQTHHPSMLLLLAPLAIGYCGKIAVCRRAGIISTANARDI